VVVVVPTTGLPRPYDVEAVPPYLAWLRQAAGAEYRAFGIRPDYSSLAGVQDIDVVGPLATREYAAFIKLIAPPPVENFYLSSSTFALPQPLSVPDRFDLSTDYPRARPVLDWLGVRFLVIERGVFGEGPGTRTDHLALFDPSAGLVVAYADHQVTILESPTAAPKAVFATAARSGTGAAALDHVRTTPRQVDGPPVVEASLDEVELEYVGGTTSPVELAEYRPNALRAIVDAPRPGVLIVKDSYFPGWEATLDGAPTDVVRVNGLVRGVVVPTAGRHEVTMRYRPTSFVYGALLGVAILILLAALVCPTWFRHARAGSRGRR